jgi:hypothetical protein
MKSESEIESENDLIHELVHALLLERTKRFAKREAVAFIDGWCSALDLMRRTELFLPGAPPELREAIAQIVEQVRSAHHEVVAERE